MRFTTPANTAISASGPWALLVALAFGLAFPGCVTVTHGRLVRDVQLVPATRPLTPGSYVIGPWVEAAGCDDLVKDFRVSDLLYQAQGEYDALIEVTIETIDEVTLTQEPNGVVSATSYGYCYRVRGRAVRALPGHEPIVVGE